eukprot:1159254-Pelagomonas_calceolata.AAC.6
MDKRAVPWMHPVRTGTETLHLWEWGRAVTESAEGGEGAFAEFLEARDTATSAAAAAAATEGASPSPADSGAIGGTSASPSNIFRHGVEYLVGCHYDAPSQQLMLVAGQDGAVGFWPLLEQQAVGGGALVGAELQPPVMALQGAHSGVVRSVQNVAPPSRGMDFKRGNELVQLERQGHLRLAMREGP